jgi:hypothetical protein
MPKAMKLDKVPVLRAIDSNTLVFSDYARGSTPSTWVADLTTGTLKGVFPNGQLLDLSADGTKMLITIPPRKTLSSTWDPVTLRTFYLCDSRTGHIEGHLEVADPARAVFLNDGRVAVTSVTSVAVWDGKSSPDFNESSIPNAGTWHLTAVGANVVVTGGMNYLLDPATGKSIESGWFGSRPVTSLDGSTFVTYARRPGTFMGISSFVLQSRDASTGQVLLEGATSQVGTQAAMPVYAWITPGVLIARFQRFSLDQPVGWSPAVRDFVLAGSLQPFGSGTDGYFPDDSTLIAGNGVLLVLDGDAVTVMTVGETTD